MSVPFFYSIKIHFFIQCAGLVLMLFVGTQSIAQDALKCATLANITKEIAELKQRGLSRGEIKKNLIDIMKLKNNSPDTFNEWMQNLDWLYQRDNVRLTPIQAQDRRLNECKREHGIIDWK